MSNNIHYINSAIKLFGKNYIIHNENEWLFPCPKCTKQNTDNLHVSLTKGLAHCFHCDFGCKLNDLYSLDNLIKNRNENNSLSSSIIVDVNDLVLYPYNSKALTKNQKQQLYNRGLTDADIIYYKICSDVFTNRIIIPNYTLGKLSDVICKWESDSSKINKYNPKYLYSKDIEKMKTLFNIYNIKQNVNTIIICEGIFDAITAGRDAIASYGCILSKYQAKLILAKKPKNIIIAYDADTAGVKGATKVIDTFKTLNYNGNLYFLLLPKGEDINSLGKEKFLNYIKYNKIKIVKNSILSNNLPNILYKTIT